MCDPDGPAMPAMPVGYMATTWLASGHVCGSLSPRHVHTAGWAYMAYGMAPVSHPYRVSGQAVLGLVVPPSVSLIFGCDNVTTMVVRREPCNANCAMFDRITGRVLWVLNTISSSPMLSMHRRLTVLEDCRDMLKHTPMVSIWSSRGRELERTPSGKFCNVNEGGYLRNSIVNALVLAIQCWTSFVPCFQHYTSLMIGHLNTC